MATKDDLLKEVRDFAKLSEDYWKEARDQAIEDLRFVFAEDQWDSAIKTARGNRPTLNANDLPIFLDQLVGDHRQNRGGIKVQPVDSQTDPQKAEIIGGLIRNIEHLSDAHVAYDKALEFTAAGGYAGAIRVITQYEDENIFAGDGLVKPEYMGEDAQNVFNQEIRIIPVDNPLNVLYDPNAKLWHKNDGSHMLYYDDIDIDLFKEKYPGKQVLDFEGEKADYLAGWYNEGDKTVRIAEWFRKEPKGSKKVYLILDEEERYILTDERPKNKEDIIKEREVEDYDIVWRLISGMDILEGPVTIPGKLFPIIPVWSKETNVNGEKKLRGMFRYAKDPQRGYIYTQSAIVELLAMSPKSPFIGTPTMFEGHETKWRTANTENHAFLTYNVDDKAPGLMPRRPDAMVPPQGLLEQAASRQQEKRNVIGLQEASMGRKSNETSGRAIAERRRAGDAVTFTFIDNLNRAIKQVGRVVLGMIPIIYTEERIVRIVGIDGKEKLQTINKPVDNAKGETEMFDLTIGKHDVIIQTGPAYGTQRLEFVDRMTQLAQYAPAVAPLIVPSIVEMMDIPQSEKVVKILEAMLPPQAQAALKGEDTGIPPEQVQQMVMQEVQKALEQYKQSVEGQIEGMKIQQAGMKTEQAQLSYEEEKIKLQEELIQLQKEIIKLEQVKSKPVGSKKDGGKDV